MLTDKKVHHIDFSKTLSEDDKKILYAMIKQKESELKNAGNKKKDEDAQFFKDAKKMLDKLIGQKESELKDTGDKKKNEDAQFFKNIKNRLYKLIKQKELELKDTGDKKKKEDAQFQKLFSWKKKKSSIKQTYEICWNLFNVQQKRNVTISNSIFKYQDKDTIYFVPTTKEEKLFQSNFEIGASVKPILLVFYFDITGKFCYIEDEYIYKRTKITESSVGDGFKEICESFERLKIKNTYINMMKKLIKNLLFNLRKERVKNESRITNSANSDENYINPGFNSQEMTTCLLLKNRGIEIYDHIKKLQQKNTFTLLKCIQLCRECAYSLKEQLHDKKIFHGDIKCDNILIGLKEKKIRHIDFGSSFYINNKNGEYISRGWYSSPNMFCVDKEQEKRIYENTNSHLLKNDIYNLAWVILEILAIFKRGNCYRYMNRQAMKINQTLNGLIRNKQDDKLVQDIHENAISEMHITITGAINFFRKARSLSKYQQIFDEIEELLIKMTQLQPKDRIGIDQVIAGFDIIIAQKRVIDNFHNLCKIIPKRKRFFIKKPSLFEKEMVAQHKLFVEMMQNINNSSTSTDLKKIIAKKYLQQAEEYKKLQEVYRDYINPFKQALQKMYFSRDARKKINNHLNRCNLDNYKSEIKITIMYIVNTLCKLNPYFLDNFYTILNKHCEKLCTSDLLDGLSFESNGKLQKDNDLSYKQKKNLNQPQDKNIPALKSADSDKILNAIIALTQQEVMQYKNRKLPLFLRLFKVIRFRDKQAEALLGKITKLTKKLKKGKVSEQNRFSVFLKIINESINDSIKADHKKYKGKWVEKSSKYRNILNQMKTLLFKFVPETYFQTNKNHSTSFVKSKCDEKKSLNQGNTDKKKKEEVIINIISEIKEETREIPRKILSVSLRCSKILI
ncbi:MAG: serine/threonine-protein kinase [Gammaproteobacteria bacterium]